MQQLSNEVYNHIIIFKDRSKKWINDDVYQNLLKIGENEKFSVNGGVYDFNMVSKILTREEFTREYPEDCPAVYSQVKTNVPIKLNKNRRELLLKGIENVVGRNDFYINVKRVIAKKDYLTPSELIGY